MINSKSKGKRGELQACAALWEHLGVAARRSQQYKGSADSADLEHDLPGIHIEVTVAQRVNLTEKMQQATDDAGDWLTPLLLHKKKRGDWHCTVKLSDLMALAMAVADRGGKVFPQRESNGNSGTGE